MRHEFIILSFNTSPIYSHLFNLIDIRVTQACIATKFTVSTFQSYFLYRTQVLIAGNCSPAFIWENNIQFIEQGKRI